ncbi:sigma-70 family RNA polymerase sigma factor [Corynebacterium atypicum]|uniref:sigma-70 family RNA polymerase sigma factor n=1 Tax=Corynebacterium atypicum TaxID=191610 RepID=UPI000691D78F|nr:sigma-70 family RNA polymerase sigma factor [Corynebacterium atypicum]
MDHRSDLELVRSYCSGEEEAFTAIVRRHRARLTWVARRYSRREEDAQDIVQEALLRAAMKLHTFRAEAKLTTWLHRLVTNAAFDYTGLARNRNESAVLDDDTRLRPALTGGGLAHDPMHSVDLRLSLVPALGAIAEGQAAALVATHALGLSVEHAARILGVRPGTIKSRTKRGRDQLRKLIDASLRQDASTTARPGQIVC